MAIKFQEATKNLSKKMGRKSQRNGDLREKTKTQTA
jgi:hypothetical protein